LGFLINFPSFSAVPARGGSILNTYNCEKLVLELHFPFFEPWPGMKSDFGGKRQTQLFVDVDGRK